ncbi:hypothetical protein cypCar_00029512 [Cyprinus carpio]|nr:hypothetical protein cypCar_00029512 [Cyprinus carpio]
MEKMSYTFSQQYEEKIRPCIDTIDRLRSLGVEKDLALPAIAVIGDQSSGKSSVLEALSGVALPRGSGIVTRCPLELKMIRTKDETKWHGRISYNEKEEDIHDPAEVEKKICEAQNEMAGAGVGISDELISLQITSASVPDLTLIDLPGIARVAVKGQPEDIGDQKSLPRLEEQIEAKLAETQKELEAYGNGPPSDPAERLSFFIDKVTAFTHDMFNLTTGEEVKCASDLLVFPELREEFAEWNVVLYRSGVSFNRKIEKEVDNYEAKYRGRELPGFINYKTFEGLVREQIKLLEKPALKTLKTVSDVVRRKFIQLAQCSFIGFPNLLKIAKTKIEAIKQDKERLAESMLRTQFKMELIVYSQDGTYSQSLKHAKDKLEEAENAKLALKMKKSSIVSVDVDTGNHATLREMRLHLESYYMIASKRLADQIPMVIRYLLLQEAALELQRNMLQLLHDKDGIDNLLKEDSDIGQKRENLLKRQKRLMKARSLLVTF